MYDQDTNLIFTKKKKKIPSEDSPEVVTERENAIYFESKREREKEQSKEKEEK